MRSFYVKHSSLLSLLLLFSGIVACKGKHDAQPRRGLEPVVEQPYAIEAGTKDPIASAQARKGGLYTSWGGPFPKSLNYWLDNWHLSGEIMGLLFESLLGLHATRNEAVGVLAQSWTQAPDKKSFTFQIHPKARWSNGDPVTAEDVLFYYDTIMNPKHKTSPSRVVLSRFERPQVLNEKTIRIKSKKVYWKAFWDAGFFRAFPKKIWENKDFNRINFQFPVVNGPYSIAELKRKRYILLKRRGDWWGRIRKYEQHKYNFDYIRYRFMEDRVAALEAFKKRNFDVYPIYTSSLWVQQTGFEAVSKNWVIRQEIYNKAPKSFQGFAINMRLPKFQDVRVRRALCHLLNRTLMNRKLMFEQYFLLNSYFPDLYPKNKNPHAPFCLYDPKQAYALLDAAGWKVSSKDGIRRRNGASLQISFLTSMSDLRHTNIYLEDLKKAGIDASIEQISHATLTQRVNDFKFDLLWQNTGASRLRDPEGLFHSKTANQTASANISGLQDAKVDQILEALKKEKNLNRRNRLFQKLDMRLLELAPYVLLWQADKTRLLYWNRFGRPRYVLDKYNNESAAIAYWWLDKKKDRILKEAQAKDQALSAEPPKVFYP